MVLLALAVLTVVVLAFPAPGPTSIDSLVTGLVKALPGLFGWFWELSYDLLIAWTLVLIAVALFAHRRKRLLFEELLAGAVAVGLALVAGWLAGTDWSDSFKAVAASGSPPIYLAVRLALATAVVVVASPYLARPLRYLGRVVVGIGAVAGIALGTSLPIGMVAAFAVGIGSAAIVHLLFGSPAGRLTADQVADALAELGVEATRLRQAPLEPRGVAIATAEAPDGRSLLVKVYGRDAWDGQLLASAWSSLWYRGDTPHLSLGRREQVEHEAFVTLLAERAGVSVLPVVAAGMAFQRDALLVTETTGRPLRTLDPQQVDDQLLEGIWRNLGRLHALGVAHRRLDGSRILIRPDGTPAFGDFAGAAVAADDADIAADRAQVLVATALAAGPERAASAALAALGDRRPRPGAAAAAAGGGRAADPPRDRRPGLGPRRPEEGLRRGVRRRASQARAAAAGVAPVGRRGAPDRVGRLRDHLRAGQRRAGQPDRRVQGGGPRLAGRRVGAVARDPDGEGRRDPRRLVPASPVRARAHARLRHPVHRPGRAELGRPARPRYPLLRAQRHRRRRRGLHQRDHQRLRVRRPGPAHCGDRPVGAGVP